MADDRLARYTQAMTIDVKTNLPMPKVGVESGQYVRKSTDPKPTGCKEGDSLYLWDTKVAFLHDGIDWRQL
jgi:hypothetical protein